MAIEVTHNTTVVVPDDGTSPVGSDEWNASHTVTGAVAAVPSTDNAVVRFNGTSGSIQDSGNVTIDDNGNLVVGYTTTITVNSITAKVETVGNGNNEWGQALIAVGNHPYGCDYGFYKNRSAANPNTHTIVQNDDELWGIYVYGADGVDYRLAAKMQFFVDGTPGANDMPGRISFLTSPNGSFVPEERMRIDNAGRVNVGFVGAQGVLPLGAVQFSIAADSDFDYNTRFASYHASGIGPVYGAGHAFTSTRGTTPNAHVVLTVDDILGYMQFLGSDGTSWTNAAEFRAEVDGTPGSGDMPGRFVFMTTPDGAATPVERMRIDNAGRVIIGGTSGAIDVASGVKPALQVHGTGVSGQSQVTITRWQNAATSPSWNLAKSRGATVGSYTVVQSGDQLGQVKFYGDDGDEFIIAAGIQANVDGTPGASDMPGRLVFQTTADGESDVTERMRIDSAGRVLLNSTADVSVDSFPTRFQIVNDSNYWNGSHVAYGNNSTGPDVAWAKTRGAGPSTHVAVNNADELYAHYVYGSDGTQYRLAGRWGMFSEGSSGSNDMPSQFTIRNRASSATFIQTRMQISGAGLTSLINSDALTTSIFRTLELRHTAIGLSGAAGMGVGMQFTVQTGAFGADEVGAAIDAVATDVTSTSEDFDLVFKTMAAGATAAERVRIDSTGLLTCTGAIKTTSTVVTGLPSAATSGEGARAFVTDATTTTFLSVVAGSGANKVPVVSDGTNWLIG